MIAGSAIAETAIAEQKRAIIPPVFLSTPPTVAPTIIAVSGLEGLAQSLTPSANAFQPAGSYSSIVVEITSPQTPKFGAYS